MNIKMKLIVGLGLLLIVDLVSAQSNAIFQIKTFNANGVAINSGTGFLIDNGSKGIAHSKIFKNANNAKIILEDSTVFKVGKIVGENEETGLLKFDLQDFTGKGKSVNLISHTFQKNQKFNILTRNEFDQLDKKNRGDF